MNRFYIFALLGILASFLYIRSFTEEHFTGPSKPYMPYDPKMIAINPFGDVSQIFWTLQSPKNCEAEKQAVLNNPLGPSQKDIDALYQCRYNSYDRMQIRNLPFGQGISG
jgi:hypothetical protein